MRNVLLAGKGRATVVMGASHGRRYAMYAAGRRASALGLSALALAALSTIHLPRWQGGPRQPTAAPAPSEHHTLGSRGHGNCTSEDLAVMWAHGAGTGTSSWGGSCFRCGLRNYGVRSGLDLDGVETCYRGLGLSASCARCFRVQTDYSSRNCRLWCARWYSEPCTACNRQHSRDFEACTGHAMGVDLPGPDPEQSRPTAVGQR